MSTKRWTIKFYLPIFRSSYIPDLTKFRISDENRKRRKVVYIGEGNDYHQAVRIAQARLSEIIKDESTPREVFPKVIAVNSVDEILPALGLMECEEQ